MQNLLEKLKAFIKKPYGLFVVIAVATLIIFIVIIKTLNTSSNPAKTATSMEDSKNSQVQSNVRYTTQETLSTLTGETDNLEKSVAEVQKQFAKLKNDQSQTSQNISKEVQQELAKLEQQNKKFKEQLQSEIELQASQQKTAQEKEQNPQSGSKYDNLPIGGSDTVTENQTVWIKDMAAQATEPTAKTDDSLLHNHNDNNEQQPKPIPKYTIPANTILTGVISEQPLIGVIPLDGTVLNPETVQFAVGQKNLAANNWHLPEALKGIQGSATCQGVFNFQNSSVSCNITSLTFIFADGAISTATADAKESFGKLTTLYGNPYIPGSYHGNALYGATGTGVFSAAQGFGNAFAASQVETQTNNTQSMVTSFKNANDYAFGQGIGTAGEALNQWWISLMKSTTNYVYVPNWNPKTHKILQLNAKIEKQVNIDYDPTGRKVNYEQKNSYSNNSLD